jgi:hypothetical protein
MGPWLQNNFSLPERSPDRWVPSRCGVKHSARRRAWSVSTQTKTQMVEDRKQDSHESRGSRLSRQTRQSRRSRRSQREEVMPDLESDDEEPNLPDPSQDYPPSFCNFALEEAQTEFLNSLRRMELHLPGVPHFGDTTLSDEELWSILKGLGPGRRKCKQAFLDPSYVNEDWRWDCVLTGYRCGPHFRSAHEHCLDGRAAASWPMPQRVKYMLWNLRWTSEPTREEVKTINFIKGAVEARDPCETDAVLATGNLPCELRGGEF